MSPDGTRVVFNELTPTRQRDLQLLTLTPTPRVDAAAETPFDERGGIVSPDGRWLAYESNSRAGSNLRAAVSRMSATGQWQVSNGRRLRPLWAPAVGSCSMSRPTGALMPVPVEPRGATWSAGAATQLIEGALFHGAGYSDRQYDVSPDGERFLMIKEGEAPTRPSRLPA